MEGKGMRGPTEEPTVGKVSGGEFGQNILYAHITHYMHV